VSRVVASVVASVVGSAVVGSAVVGSIVVELPESVSVAPPESVPDVVVAGPPHPGNRSSPTHKLDTRTIVETIPTWLAAVASKWAIPGICEIRRLVL